MFLCLQELTVFSAHVLFCGPYRVPVIKKKSCSSFRAASKYGQNGLCVFAEHAEYSQYLWTQKNYILLRANVHYVNIKLFYSIISTKKREVFPSKKLLKYDITIYPVNGGLLRVYDTAYFILISVKKRIKILPEPLDHVLIMPRKTNFKTKLKTFSKSNSRPLSSCFWVLLI